MERFTDINEISDGKKYNINDMVKIECHNCEGCFSCCINMNGLITLDPYDIYRMTNSNNGDNNNFTFEMLISSEKIELTVDRGIIIPTLKMDKSTSKCSFLNKNGRCSIHSIRPGICRLFPMGRLYENGSFYYFLQKNECKYENKTKVKLKKWLDTPEINRYEKFINDWHYFIKNLQEKVKGADDITRKNINMLLLQIFYIEKYNEKNFYEEFNERMEKYGKACNFMEN